MKNSDEKAVGTRAPSIGVWGHPRQMSKVWKALEPLMGDGIPKENTECVITLQGESREAVERLAMKVKTLVTVREMMIVDADGAVRGILAARPKGDKR